MWQRLQEDVRSLAVNYYRNHIRCLFNLVEFAMKRLLYIITASLLVLQSCETDFEVNAPWKDVTIVYGLLNQVDSIHYIKIRKGFLGKEDAGVMAQVQDSAEYGPGDISVKVLQLNNGALIQTYNVLDTPLTNKVSGSFSAPNQTMHYFIDPNLNEAYDYKLEITNNKSGKVVTASTKLINDFSISYPGTNPKQRMSFYCDNLYRDIDIKWYTGTNGRRYQLTMRFNYGEVNLSTGDSVVKFVDMVFPVQVASKLDGGDLMSVTIGGETFYQYLQSKLTPVSSQNNVKRCIYNDEVNGGPLDFFIDVAAEDFHTYIEVNEPSTGIVQERPEFTNVTDEKGNDEVGIFSSRYTKSRKGKLLGNTCIQGNSVTQLKTGTYTSTLGFEVCL